MQGAFAVLSAHAVDGLVEADELGCFLKHIELLHPVYQAAELYAHQTYEHAAGVKPPEQLLAHGNEYVVEGSIGHGLLQGVGVEVGVAYLHGDAACELLLLAQAVGHLLAHAHQQVVDVGNVDGVGFEGAFGADGLSLAPGLHRAAVDAVGPPPYLAAVLAHHVFHHFGRYAAQGANGGNAHGAQGVIGLGADHRDLADRQGIEEWTQHGLLHLYLSVGLGLARGDLRHGLVERQTHGDGQPGFLYNVLPQLRSPLIAAKEAVHARDVEVMLIDGGFFEHRRPLGNDLCDQVGVLAVVLKVAANEHGIGAEVAGQLHGHGRMHPILPCLVAAACHHATVAHAANDYGLADKTAVVQALNRHKESVLVEVCYGAGHRIHKYFLLRRLPFQKMF